MAQEAMDVCLRVLKESNKSRFDSYGVRNSNICKPEEGWYGQPKYCYKKQYTLF